MIECNGGHTDWSPACLVIGHYKQRGCQKTGTPGSKRLWAYTLSPNPYTQFSFYVFATVIQFIQKLKKKDKWDTHTSWHGLKLVFRIISQWIVAARATLLSMPS